MKRSIFFRPVIALALTGGLLAAHGASAQAPPGSERPGAGAPNVGDPRAIPGPDPQNGSMSHPSDTRPLLRQPDERRDRSAKQPAGAPNAGDPRALPDGDARRPRSATTPQDRYGAYAEPRSVDIPDATGAKP